MQGGLGASGPLIQTPGSKAEEAPAAEEAKAAEPEAEKEEAPAASAEPDDLTKIEGIGPKVSELLTASGVSTFKELSDASADSIKATLTEAGGVYAAMEPASWPQQAALAAAGEWDKLQTLQDELDGGKLPS